jgi:hypothetical protein
MVREIWEEEGGGEAFVSEKSKPPLLPQVRFGYSQRTVIRVCWLGSGPTRPPLCPNFAGSHSLRPTLVRSRPSCEMQQLVLIGVRGRRSRGPWSWLPGLSNAKVLHLVMCRSNWRARSFSRSWPMPTLALSVHVASSNNGLEARTVRVLNQLGFPPSVCSVVGHHDSGSASLPPFAAIESQGLLVHLSDHGSRFLTFSFACYSKGSEPEMAKSPEEQGMAMVAVVAFLVPLTTIFVALRFYTRAVLTDSLWWFVDVLPLHVDNN